MSKPISRKIGDRLLRAVEHASEFKTTYHKALPVVEHNWKQVREMVDDLKRLQEQGTVLMGEIGALYGYMQEGAEISEAHWDEMAQTTTLAVNLDVFFRGDPAQVEHVLRLADRAVLEEVLGRLPPERLVVIQKALTGAVGAYPDEQKTKKKG